MLQVFDQGHGWVDQRGHAIWDLAVAVDPLGPGHKRMSGIGRSVP